MHPVLLHLFGYAVQSHGVLSALGIAAAIWITWRRAMKMSPFWSEQVMEFGTIAALAGIVGARLEDVFADWGYYSQHLSEIPAMWKGGASIQGGLIGGVLAGVLYTWYRKLPFWRFADLFAPGILVGMGIGRMGCLMAGDTWSIPTTSFLGVHYLPDTPAGQIAGGQALLPTEMLEGVVDWLIAGLLVLFYRHVRRRPVQGEQFMVAAAAYSVSRIGWEFLRRDSLLMGPQLKIAQLIALATIGLALICWLWQWRRGAYVLPRTSGGGEGSEVQTAPKES